MMLLPPGTSLQVPVLYEVRTGTFCSTGTTALDRIGSSLVYIS